MNTPWVPYSQPSGPHEKVLSISWVSWYPQPSSRTCGGPAGTSVPSLTRDEEQVGRCADEHAAESDLDSAHQVQAFDEHLAAVERAVAVGVLEDEDAILAFTLRRAHRVGVCLGDPQPAAVVDR